MIHEQVGNHRRAQKYNHYGIYRERIAYNGIAYKAERARAQREYQAEHGHYRQAVMRELYVELFEPAHLAAVYVFAVLFHIFEVALRPLALPLFERNVVYGEFLAAHNVGSVNYVHSRVFYLYGKGYVLGNHVGEPARLFVAGAAYRHSVSDKRIRAVKVLYNLNGGAVAAHAQPHESLEYVFAALRHVPRLNGSAVFVVHEIFDYVFDIVGRDNLVAV